MKTIYRLLILLLLLVSKAQAVTSDDYYKAGLQLYNAKSYAKAVQYFSAALSLDPNNAAALQGRANCYYVQGQYQQALADYQKELSFNPSNAQLSQFVQSLQAKVGAAPAAPGTGAPSTVAATSGEAFNQGVALYQQRQYAAAVPSFQKAVQENPNDSKAYYYLGATQMMLGDSKNAAVALGLSNKLSPNPSIAGYVNQLKARLTPEDQQWVDSQIANGGSSQTASAAAKPKSFGIRIEPAITLLNLADFDGDAQAFKALAQYVQGPPLNDASVSYGASVPTGCPNIGLEPVVRLGSNFEIGLPLAILPVGTVSESLSDGSNISITQSFQLSAFSAGLNLRYLFGNGDFQPFVGFGGLFVPISISHSENFSTPALGTSNQYSGNYSGTAIGGQAQLGLDWHLGDTFVVSPYVGYQFVSANSFQGTATSNPSGSPSSSQSAELDVIPTAFGGFVAPTAGGKIIIPVENGPGTALFTGDPVPSGTRPLQVDLSGITGGLMVSAFF